MATRIENYMVEMLRRGSDFLGAYNMGVWGVSVSNKGPLTDGLSACGDLLRGNPKFSGGAVQNWVKYYDTPNLWGFGGDAQWSTAATTAKVQQEVTQKKARKGLVDRWEAVIAQSKYLVDITSLSPPVTGHVAQHAICNGIKRCLTSWIKAPTDKPLMIRVLFGMTAAKMYGTGANTYWEPFKKLLTATLAPLAAGISQAAKKSNVDPPVVIYGSDMGKMISTFNHSKIVAGDGQYAVVGGHNMCEEISSNTAPVIHDITCEVTGPGARTANAFAGSLWLKAAESGRLYLFKFDWAKKSFADLSTDSTKKWAPDNWVKYELGDQAEVPKVIKNQHWFYPMQELPARNAVAPPAGSVVATAIMGVGRWGDTKVFGADGTKGLKLGKELPNKLACHYASDTIKRLMISDPKNTLIRMSQQDLINTGVFGGGQKSEHTICELLGKRLKATPKNTTIQIVVSSRFTQNSEGLAYSYGDGPREAVERISDTIVGEGHASSKVARLPSRLAVLDLTKTQASASLTPVNPVESLCTVAPLAFCDAHGTTRDRGSYVWSNARYQMEKIYSNGRFWNKDDKKELKFGPGNHAKVICVSTGDNDSTGMVMIGSDNMYPSPLSEFSFVIEGTEAIKAFREQYWDKLWGYSARLGFTVMSDGNVV
ncbi:MAG: hypothetical protein JKY56_26440 [Kofleriaceae bacterium]|nr:hypothetical protein [Kofleriaceae bacterium]